MVMGLLSFLLAGCQSVADATGARTAAVTATEQRMAGQIRAREDRLLERQAFQVQGGLGIWTDEESVSARVLWQQDADQLNLTLTGPLGMGTLELVSTAAGASITRGDTLLATGRSPDDTLRRVLALAAPVPVGELAFWIRGLPGNANSVARDTQGRLLSLRYVDDEGTSWHARFRRYSSWDGVQVPALITASGGDYSVRLVLKDWLYPTPSAAPEKVGPYIRLPIPGR
jgi:outer membrane lipoprotein LolB